MKQYVVLLVVLAVLVLWAIPAGVLAQTQTCGVPGTPPCDQDHDGVPDSIDQCVNVPGPATNNGCPVTAPAAQPSTGGQPQHQSQHPPGDSDGDGTPDSIDQCPLQGGPDWNHGCPTNLTAPPTPVTLPALPTGGRCMVATTGPDVVNVRDMPALNGAIIAVLHPQQIYDAEATFGSGIDTWYQVANGWSSGSVLRSAGHCDALPSFEFHNVQIAVTPLGNGPAMLINFMPTAGGSPEITVRPFGGSDAALNFTTDPTVPSTALSFILTPFGDGSNPGTIAGLNPQPLPPRNLPGFQAFGDGSVRGMMGDGSIFLLPSDVCRGANTCSADANPLDGILIGLSEPAIDPTGLFGGLSQPAIDPTGILFGPSLTTALDGTLDGLILPPLGQGGTTPGHGMLIGLLLPAVSVARDPGPVGSPGDVGSTQPGSAQDMYNTAQQAQPGSAQDMYNTAQQAQPGSAQDMYNTAQQAQPGSAQDMYDTALQGAQSGSSQNPGDIGATNPGPIQNPGDAGGVNPGPQQNPADLGGKNPGPIGNPSDIGGAQPGAPQISGSFFDQGGSLLVPAVQNATSLNLSLGNGWSLNVGGITQGATAQ